VSQSPQWTSQLSASASSIEKLLPPQAVHASSTLIQFVFLAFRPVAPQHLLGIVQKALRLFDAPPQCSLVFLYFVSLAPIELFALNFVPHYFLSYALRRAVGFPANLSPSRGGLGNLQMPLNCRNRVADRIHGTLQILARNAEPFGPVANLMLLAHRNSGAVLRAA